MSNKRKISTKKDTASSRKKKAQKLEEKSDDIEMTDNLSDSDIDMTPDIDDTWVSASKTRNFMLRDPLLDWLSMYGEQKGFIPNSQNENSVQKGLNFGKFIMEKGIEFEAYIISIMKNNHGKEFHEVDGSPIWNQTGAYQKKIHRQLKDTYQLMKNGAKIIYQGLVYNPANKTWGYPDLIVRSDYLNSLCETKTITDEKAKKGCRFSNNWHYRIVDIKYATLKMKVNGKSLLNQGSILPYKAQTYIYNRAIGHMQNLVPRKAYLLGRGWNTSKMSVTKPFDRLGQVDFHGGDEEIGEDVKASIEWIRNLRKSGSGWQVLPVPSIPELYPNMCNDSNNDWGNAKKKIAEELHEITNVWQCGVDDREMCHGKKVFRWSDKKCTAELMNKGGQINPPMINKILEINRGNDKFYIDKNVEINGWKRDDKIPSFFIDFETVSNINNIRATDEDGNIFMIGSLIDSTNGVTTNDNGEERKESDDEFSCFISGRLTFRDEKKVIEDFLKYVSDECTMRNSNKCRFYHYSFAEPSAFKKAVQKYNITIPPSLEIEWMDLLRIVKELKFIVKGAMDFSLKSIIEALFKHGMISTSYSGENVGNGMQAMISAFHCDEIALKQSIPMYDLDLMKSVKSYNKIDCVVLKSLRDLLEKIIK